MDHIIVTYEAHSTAYSIRRALIELSKHSLMSFDTETKGVYSKEERKIAMKALETDLSSKDRKIASLIAFNSGLSYPSLVNVTHFVFGLTESKSIILIPPNDNTELLIWSWMTNYCGMLAIHNTLFDLKLMYHRTGALPRHYEDTQLMAKTLINNSAVWKAKVGLKDIMGSYYDPKWVLMNDYEPDNPREKSFLHYAAIDGAATYKLYQMIKGEF
jgi:hypothetical protein